MPSEGEIGAKEKILMGKFASKVLRTHGGSPGGPVVKTSRSQCRGPGLDPWSRNRILHATKTGYSQNK